ncbi:glycoside hydrolase family 20 protein [Arenibacter echinorum]|uniref:beta-N-acetylhexosaminidase n=1 Tax=Arenibacter echinorum TaxID=440515 RepID=A0A327RK83_9FLAO|nr:glycoside hydrolase family 20 protein [Arenibacter echinorum]RAJ15974.1 hexosaminidase [Arenibacter echinorum]
MYSSRLALLFILLVVTACKNIEPPKMGIIPQPNEINYQEGAFTINDKTVIVVENNIEAKQLANGLGSFLKDKFNLTLEYSTTAQDNAIHLIKTSRDGDYGAYNLNIGKEGVVIEGSTDQGIYYGLQTLKQMLSPKANIKEPLLNYVHVNDAPAYKWRGMMLDVARHFVPKDSIKKVLDILAMHKMNKFHWHLVDGIGWRIQIDAYPELIKKGAWRKVKGDKKPWEDFEATYRDSSSAVYGGYYTKDDLREIVAYAKERYIDIIPEIEMPGHSEAALQCFPEFSCDTDLITGVYCAGNEGTFEFLQNIISEVVDIFPNEYLHIGGDEVGKESWLKCDKCKKRMQQENLQTAEELQSYFVSRMEKYINTKNRKLIGWDEILEGGLPERATVMSWRGFAGGIEAANAGHDVVMTPGDPLYLDHSQGKSEYEPPSWGGYNNVLKIYDFNPVPKDIAPDKKHHILGAQGNLWTEQVKSLSHIQYMMLPRISALSEAIWTKAEKKNREHFINKLDVHFDRLDEMGYNYSGSSLTPDYDVSYNKVNKVFNLRLHNELDLYEIRYTLDGSNPTMQSELYSGPIEYTTAIELNAMCFRNGEPIGFPLKKMFSTGFGDQCKVTYSNAYNETYGGGGDKALFDNKFAIARGDDPSWQGIKEKDFEVLIDLGSVNELSYVGLNFFQDIGATSVMLPTKVIISISKDGENFKTVLDEAIATQEKREPIIKTIKSNFDKQDVSHIKIIAKNRSVLPEWHIRKGPAWIFVDEISVK